MKKLGIFILMVTLIAGVSFAQVSEKLKFELNNATGANGGKLNPILYATTEASAASELGPGSLGFYGAFTYIEGFNDRSNNGVNGIDDLEAKVSYSIPAGPGTLGIAADWVYGTWAGGSRIAPIVSYTGIAAGPVTLGLGVELRIGYQTEIAGNAMDSGTKGGLDQLIAILNLGFLDGALGVTYKFDYDLAFEEGNQHGDSIGNKGVARIAYLDINYKINDTMNAGIELDDTHSNFKAFTLNPYFNYGISEHIGVGLNVKLTKIAAEFEDIVVSPAVYFKYTF